MCLYCVCTLSNWGAGHGRRNSKAPAARSRRPILGILPSPGARSSVTAFCPLYFRPGGNQKEIHLNLRQYELLWEQRAPGRACGAEALRMLRAPSHPLRRSVSGLRHHGPTPLHRRSGANGRGACRIATSSPKPRASYLPHAAIRHDLRAAPDQRVGRALRRRGPGGPGSGASRGAGGLARRRERLRRSSWG